MRWRFLADRGHTQPALGLGLGGLGLPPAFQCRIGEGDGELGIDGRPDHGSLELHAAADSDALAVAFHCQAQRRRHAGAVGLAGHGQTLAVIAHGRAAGAVDDRALLRDAVDHRGMAGLRLAVALDGVALEALGRLAGAQRIERLAVAGRCLLLEPVGPRPPAVLVVDRRPLLVVALVDRLQVGPQRGAGLGIQQLLGQPAIGQVLDGRPPGGRRLLGVLDGPILPALRLGQHAGPGGREGLLCALVPGVKLGRVQAAAQTHRPALLVVAPCRRGLALGRRLERAKPLFKGRLGQVAGQGAGLDDRAVAGLDDQAVTACAQRQAVIAHDLVQLGPARRALDLVQALALDPADQAFHAGVLLQVAGPGGRAALA